VYQLAAYSESK